MGKEIVTVPTVKGMKSALKDFGKGALGGLIFMLAVRLFGPLGVIAAPLAAGSFLKGDTGTMIATMSGFLLLAMGGIGGTSSASSDAGVI